MPADDHVTVPTDAAALNVDTSGDGTSGDEATNDEPTPRARFRSLVIAVGCAAVLAGLTLWALTRPPAEPVTALTAPVTSRNLEPKIKFPDRTDPLPAPPLVVPALNSTPGLPAGSTIDLANFRGRPVVVNFWASWCGPCRREMPSLSDLAERYGDRVAFVGIATQDREAPARAFAREVDVTYPLGFDAGDKLTDSYGVFGLPTTYFIDGGGTVVDARFGEMTTGQFTERITSLFGVPAP